MTDALARLRKLAEAATPGPLDIERRDDDCGYMNYILHGGKGDFAWFRDELDPRAKQNAELVRAVVSALPLLLDLVEAADRLRKGAGHAERVWENEMAYDTARAALEKVGMG